ncbi:MAG: MFS transporter [Candidatus Omnitrophica bacterium]|nr:MFS transporter [Candidatus Omnitrophota bacterium]
MWNRERESHPQRWRIFLSAGLRAVAVGLSGVILSLHLATLAFNPSRIGLTIALGLTGCALGTLVVTGLADRVGRRRSLVALAWGMSVGGLLLAGSASSPVVMLAVFIGMVNGMGRDRGASMTVEQAILPQTTTSAERTKVFAWYNVIVDAGHAVGSLLGSVPALLRQQFHVPALESYQWTWGLYSVLCLLAGASVVKLSRGIEVAVRSPTQSLSPASRQVVAKFAGLSTLDSLGGGFLTTALVSYWFFQRFGVDEAFLGPLFFLVRILNGLSHLGAAWLARRIGLVNTMVWTHLPSSLLLMTVPIAPNLTVAVVLFLIREALVEMDVPTRQSYIVAVVKEDERTRASGITNLTRGVAWAVAPAIAGPLMRTVSLSAPFLIGPGLKIAYDLLLYRAFRQLTPPEERRLSRVAGCSHGEGN